MNPEGFNNSEFLVKRFNCIYKYVEQCRCKFTLTDDGKAIRPDETVSQEELLSTI
ncbi:MULTISPECIES: hypothetical protein [Methanosarcina]|uniref:hypothetical protein n=1 Tax=Methanosarcina TaxID=2207 RepID=UPI000AE439A6|nr:MULTISPECIES: hypothetical protein [Methanosarcina]MCC4767067.1 hypothetical protein [Methanosarcina sp. DH1]